jgi:metal-responsive CopG/Arc/MetJ family transcriptional regulator
MESRRTFSMRLPEALARDLDRRGREIGLSRADILRLAAQRFLAEERGE